MFKFRGVMRLSIVARYCFFLPCGLATKVVGSGSALVRRCRHVRWHTSS